MQHAQNHHPWLQLAFELHNLPPSRLLIVNQLLVHSEGLLVYQQHYGMLRKKHLKFHLLLLIGGRTVQNIIFFSCLCFAASNPHSRCLWGLQQFFLFLMIILSHFLRAFKLKDHLSVSRAYFDNSIPKKSSQSYCLLAKTTVSVKSEHPPLPLPEVAAHSTDSLWITLRMFVWNSMEGDRNLQVFKIIFS